MSLPASANDILYLKILIFSFIAAFGVKHVPLRNAYCAGVGLLLVSIVCGGDLLHSLALAFGNLIILSYYPRQHLAKLSFVYTFGYLAFFRSCHFLGLPKACPHSNAVQLLMSLRCIGLAFEIQEKEEKEKKESHEKNETSSNPQSSATIALNAWSYFEYYFNFIGLFTGLYYTYRLHVDMVESPYLHRVPSLAKILHNSIVLPPILITILLLVSTFFNVEDAHLDAFYEQSSFLYRVFFMVPIFVFLRMRLYVAWTLAEACCAASGLGAYPVEAEPKIGQGVDRKKYESFLMKSGQDGFDWTKVEFSFEAINNLDIYGCEFATKFRDSMKCWNRSVQYWLSNYIYRRSPRSIRTVWTLAVSAFWHGIHPGYYFSFLTIPVCLLAEDLMFEAFEPRSLKKPQDANSNNNSNYEPQQGDETPTSVSPKSVSPNSACRGFDQPASYPSSSFSAFWWFFRVRALEYMNMPFLLLTYGSTLRFLTSIYFYVHILLVIFIAAASTAIQLKMASAAKQKTG